MIGCVSDQAQAILVGTVLIAVVLPLVSSVTYLASASGPGSFYRAAGFLTTAAPCAMLMTPLVYVSAIAAVTQKCALCLLLPVALMMLSSRGHLPAGCHVQGNIAQGRLSPGRAGCLQGRGAGQDRHTDYRRAHLHRCH